MVLPVHDLAALVYLEVVGGRILERAEQGLVLVAQDGPGGEEITSTSSACERRTAPT